MDNITTISDQRKVQLLNLYQDATFKKYFDTKSKAFIIKQYGILGIEYDYLFTMHVRPIGLALVKKIDRNLPNYNWKQLDEKYPASDTLQP